MILLLSCPDLKCSTLYYFPPPKALSSLSSQEGIVSLPYLLRSLITVSSSGLLSMFSFHQNSRCYSDNVCLVPASGCDFSLVMYTIEKEKKKQKTTTIWKAISHTYVLLFPRNLFWQHWRGGSSLNTLAWTELDQVQLFLFAKYAKFAAVPYSRSCNHWQTDREQLAK